MRRIIVFLSIFVLLISQAYGEPKSEAKKESPSVTDKIFNFFGMSSATKNDKKETVAPKISTTSSEPEKDVKKDKPVPVAIPKVVTSDTVKEVKKETVVPSVATPQVSAPLVATVIDAKKEAPPVVAPAEPVKPAETPQDKSNISLEFQGKTLKQALDSIKEKTGIQFKISEALGQKTVLNDIKAESWKTAVQKLLQNYNKVEMWQDDLAKSQIMIVGESEGTVVVASKTPPTKQEPMPSAKPTSQNTPAKAPDKKNDIKSQMARIPENPIADMIQGPEPTAERPVTVMDLDPMILLAPGVAGKLAAKGIKLPADVQAAYDMMQKDGRAHPDGEIPDQVLYNRKFQSFASNMGIGLPAPKEKLENLSPSY